MGKYKKSHSKTKGSPSEANSSGSNAQQRHTAEENGLTALQNGTSSPSDSSPPGEAEQDSTSIHEGGSEVQTQKAEPSPAALRKRNQKLKEQCRSLQDELALLKASLEEERERSELAEQSQSAWEVYATCATAVSVVLLGAAIVGFARSS